MYKDSPQQIKTIGEYHRLMGLPNPQHPLLSVIKFDDIKRKPDGKGISIITGFYSVALKKNFSSKLKYGQQEYDFDEGVLAFIAPGQIIGSVTEENKTLNHLGLLLLVHPDFLWNTPLAKKIKQYDYFNYKINEALHLSDKEEGMIKGILLYIEQEYHSVIDKYSQDVVIAQIELLLTYAERYYQRQFITRKITNHSILSRLESTLSDYFNNDDLATKGIPTVQFISEALNISPNYLSRLLKTLTGQSTKQYVQEKILDLAKQKLSTTDLTVNEIAYALGFEHPQSFSKLFKAKTNQSPLEFRHSFN